MQISYCDFGTIEHISNAGFWNPTLSGFFCAVVMVNLVIYSLLVGASCPLDSELSYSEFISPGLKLKP